ncbi:glycosyltransferase family 39 protein [Streptomyces sp. H10-C2]|uniref:glycosyltransferase family 39 protein n=1 Tax=unclassified Streptomyces TaxID=2593676 RepID=UPI0024BBB57B|nr:MULTISPECIES: glycosyltransferase family 39 protein [unclassified Streptomyces]MDJ0342111.1 glycosyltransferase family 39 protein [Streptomyces sp. PH10-H1]MDJ0368453.1 glycosyltransferase family 39 protein [Streptomyces sp. H10-C2]
MTAPSSTPSSPRQQPFAEPAPVTRSAVPDHAQPPGAPVSYGPRGPRGVTDRVWRGRPEDARWVRPAFLALLAVTAALYLWDLSVSGYANSFYSAAVQAGSESWKALFFGSSDAANSITVDKPPAALWPIAVAVRIFGLDSWSILVPEALMGVATVGVLYAAVRRRFSPAAGLIAGGALAITPVAALMFRFNNPDALLALLMTVAVYCVLRALEGARTKWLVWAGVAFGLAFLTKTLQAFLILPPLALVYAVFAPTTVRRRIGQLALAGLALVVSGGWWVAIVELWPASSRPYIGGSQDNSFLSLTFGYNGFGRITGNETGSVGGGGAGGAQGGSMWGATGITRLFDGDMGGQIAWLLPAAFLLLVAGLWLTRRAPRTDTRRAAFLVWGGSMLMTFAVFSFMSGIFHQYYNIALAPYIAAIVGMGATTLWEKRSHLAAAAALTVTAAGTGYWAYVLLGRSSDWHPWLRWAVLAGGLLAAAGLLLAVRLGRRIAAVAAGVGIAAALAAPFAYTLNTVGTGHAGSIVTAGPSVQGGMGGMRGGVGMPPGTAGGRNGQAGPGQGQQGGTGGTGGFPGGGQRPTMPGGTQNGRPQNGQTLPGQGGTDGGGRGGGGMGGLLGGASVSSAMKALLEKNASDYTWVVAAIGSQNSASYQLAIGDPVMAIGGFNGSDPSPTLAQFKKYVSEGKIHYFIAASQGGGGGGMGGQGTSAQIATWVESAFTKKTVGTTTVYDLTTPAMS